MPTLWQYESFILNSSGDTGAPDPEGIKESLNRYGKIGYQVIHVKQTTQGALVFVLARDTNRPIDEGEDTSQAWLVDVHEAGQLQS